ncbi:MAG: M23 family metallopeptidase [Caldilineaceae bacterium]|nr:M23 family metallopeptidase [Caldilineaceae bacterium]
MRRHSSKPPHWVAALVGVLALLALGRPISAQPPVPIISPTDVTTPTPGPLHFPTPTPAMPPDGAAPDATAPADLAAASFSARSIHLDADTPLTYIVKPGDTLFTVALEMGIDLDDAPCAVRQDFTANQPLVIGDVLAAPPANVVCHEVLPGETIASIAAAYFVDAEEIRAIAWNQAPAADIPLPPGAHLRVPLPLAGARTAPPLHAGAISDFDFLAIMLDMPIDTSPFVVFAQRGETRKTENSVLGPVPADWPYGSGAFTWPVYGWLSQGYRYDHRAIDVAAPQGTPVTAADRGVVLRAGWNQQGYGRFVIVDHKIDYVTLYAHLDRVLVEEGEIVGQGQVLGTVGSTGNSTGPHLHFEIRDFGRLTNPLELLAMP